MSLMERLSSFFPVATYGDAERKAFVLGAATVISLKIGLSLLSQPEAVIIKAPAKSKTGYKADFYPGGKDLLTPYGSIRVYEFGPEKGERVLFVHGITTPSPVFAGIMPKLAEAGYRVCTFDLFGRGYSDSPDLKHDDRLYNSQILCVLQSIGWTKFSLVGYSLGGCLGGSFASYFPDSIDKLFLIAPAGLLAGKDISFARRIAMTETIPTSLVNALKVLVIPGPKQIQETVAGDRVDVTDVSTWQQDNHKGFPRSCKRFLPLSTTQTDLVIDLSSFRYAPIFDQWTLFERLHQQNLKIHAILGADDDVINTQLIHKNLLKALPTIKVTVIDNVAHDICTAKPAVVVDFLLTGLKS